MINHTINKLKVRFGWTNQNDIAQALGIDPSGVSSRKKRGTLLRAIAEWAVENGHDISDILQEEESAQEPRPFTPAPAPRPEERQGPLTEDYALVGMALEVIKSDTVYATALKQNIEAFYRAVRVETETRTG